MLILHLCSSVRNLVHDYVLEASKQHDFLQLLGNNKNFKAYFNKQTKKDKAQIGGILDRCTERGRWRRMEMLTNRVTKHFTAIHGLCSHKDFPLLAYLLLVQALRDEIKSGFTEYFGSVKGEGARAKIAGMIKERFKMDGNDPTRK